MTINHRFNRRSHRLPGWDYRTPGSYYITLCTECGIEYFNNQKANTIARKYLVTLPQRQDHMAIDGYVVMPDHVHVIITITKYPDYMDGCRDVIHGVGWDDRRGDIHPFENDNKGKNVTPTMNPGNTMNVTPTECSQTEPNGTPNKIPTDKKGTPIKKYNPPGSIGAIIQGYKMITKRYIRRMEGFERFEWQRDYYDHIVRNEYDLKRIQEYIKNNPEALRIKLES